MPLYIAFQHVFLYWPTSAILSLLFFWISIAIAISITPVIYMGSTLIRGKEPDIWKRLLQLAVSLEYADHAQ